MNEIEIKHGFFTRRGGVSSGELASLNCGFRDYEPRELTLKNRTIVMDTIGLKLENLATAEQIHSNKVAFVTEACEDLSGFDGLVTKEPNLALGIKTADCAPVLFYDEKNHVIGACHAGWRGAFSGIIANTIKEMIELGAEADEISAMVGPCIAQKSYEVDNVFFKNMVDEDHANLVFFAASDRDGHFMFDLSGYVVEKLRQENIKEVTIIDQDTFSDKENFFSYRRSTLAKARTYGVQLSVIAMLKK